MRVRAVLGSLILTAGLLVGLVPSQALAADTLMFAQDHYYSVTMRSDKRAITTAKLIFENTTDKPLSSFTFTVPDGITADSMSIYQILPPKVQKGDGCKTYETYEAWQKRTNTAASAAALQDYEGGRKKCVVPLPAEYNEDYDFQSVDYTSSRIRMNATDLVAPDSGSAPDYKSYNPSFTSVTPKRNGQSYTVQLSLPVQPEKKGAVLVSYIGTGFVSELLGNYSYAYKTLKVNDSINNVVVNIYLDQDLYSREVKGKVEAPSTSSSMGIADGASTAKGQDQQNDSLLQLSQNVLSGGTVTKYSSHLLPNDSYTVTGQFADSPWKLFITDILLWLTVMGVLVAISWFGFRRYARHHAKKLAAATKGNGDYRLAAVKRHKTSEVDVTSWMDAPVNQKRAIIAACVGGFGTLATFAMTFAVVAVTTENSSNSAMIPLWFVVFVAGCLYFGLAMPLFLTMRYGRVTVFAWATFQIALLFALSVVFGLGMAAA